MLATDLSPQELVTHLNEFTFEDLLYLEWKLTWRGKARRKQIPPEDQDWNFYGVKSGRGFGKTLAAANWLGLEGARDPGSYNFVVAPTYDDVRYTCFEGPTGLFSVIPKKLIKSYNLTLPSILLKNGAIFRGFAGDAPERLRGPQCHRAWCDEIASWRYPKEAWDNLMLGLRLGTKPRVFWTGTPKPKPFIRELVKLKKSIVISGSTYENEDNLAENFFENVSKYEGTAIGRQELYGEILDPEEAGFVKRSQWRLWPWERPLPKFHFILLSLDTAFTEATFDKRAQENDPTACTVWGLFEIYDRNARKNMFHVMLLDVWEDRLGLPGLIARVKEEKELTYGDMDEPRINPHPRGPNRPRHQGRKPDMILIEDKGSGISLRQSLAVENILTESYNPGRMDKLSRLHAVSPMFAARRVWAIESKRNHGYPCDWAEPCLSQVCSYVGEGSIENDDILDTTTQALKLFMDRWRLVFTVKSNPDAESRQALERLQSEAKKGRNPYDS